jgi:hypothetical protein
MIALVICIILFMLLFFIHTKEGFEEDYRSLIIESLQSAKKDRRMKEKQIIALEDALRYANII